MTVLYESVADDASSEESHRVRRDWATQLMKPRIFVPMITLTFVIAIVSVLDFKDENGLFTRTIHILPSFLQSSPVAWKYGHIASRMNGIMILGAPYSRTSLIASYLASAGFRLSSSAESESSSMLQFQYRKGENPPSDHFYQMQPLQRYDSFDENDILLASQKMSWKSKNILDFNSTLVKARINRDNFLVDSNILPFLEGYDDDTKPWLWQDPQLCLTLPAWTWVLDDLYNNSESVLRVATIFSYNHPLEVAKFLNMKFPYEISIKTGLQLWINYNHKCISNILSSNQTCPIFTSNSKVESDPQIEIENILTKLDEDCGIAPGRPGILGRRSARKGLKKMFDYINDVIESKAEAEKIRSDDVILDAIGLNEFKFNCSHYAADFFQMDEDDAKYEWGNEKLTSAMNELFHLRSISRPEEREQILMERNRLQEELQLEILRWMGEEESDAIHQLFHLEEDTVKFITMNNTLIKKERSYYMSYVREEIEKLLVMQ